MHQQNNIWLRQLRNMGAVILFGLLPLRLFADPVILMPEIRSIGIPKETKAELTLQIRRQLQTIGKVATTNAKECLKNPSCRQRLTTERGVTHLLETQVNGLGSTFYLTLKLTDLLNNGSEPIVIKQQGKRATSTFEEIAKHGVETLISTAGLQRPSLDTTLAASTTAPPVVPALQPEAVVFSKAASNRERSSERSWYEKWWVWTIVGGVAAGAATAAVLSLDGGDNGSTANGSNNNGGGGGGGGGAGASTIQVDISIK